MPVRTVPVPRRSIFHVKGGSFDGALSFQPVLPGVPGRAPATLGATPQVHGPAAPDETTVSVAEAGLIRPIVYIVAGEPRCATVRKACLPADPAAFTDGANQPRSPGRTETRHADQIQAGTVCMIHEHVRRM
jgi:hypothetical protein